MAVCLALTAICPDAPSADPPEKRALLVGVSHYNHGGPEDWDNLNAEPDVKALRQILIERFGFPPDDDHIRTLTTVEETTHASIVGTFRAFLVEATKPGDIVYCHYSGHGFQLPDDNKDEIDGLDETLVPSDWEDEHGPNPNHIRDDEISLLLEQLKEKGPANVTMTFDCCHSGSATRGGRTVLRGRAWSGPRPPVVAPETEPESPGRLLTRGKASDLGYVVISACQPERDAAETFDDNNQPMGLLAYGLSKALSQATDGTTYRDLFEILTDTMGSRRPEQIPQIEGDIDKVLLDGVALPPPSYIPVAVDEDVLVLRAGEVQGMSEGSRFALYAAGTKDFRNTKPVAEARIVEIEPTASVLELTAEFEGKVTPEELRAARAVETQHQYGDNRLKVEASALGALPRGREILDQIGGLPLVDLGAAAADGWNVRLRPVQGPAPEGGEGGPGRLALEREDGVAIATLTDGPDLVREMCDALERESRWRFVKALENRATGSLIQVELRLVPVEVKKNRRGKVTEVVGDRDIALSEGGQMTLAPGDAVMVEWRNSGNMDAYGTVLDLRSNGTIGPLYPHPSLAHRVDENKIPADKQWHRIPFPYVWFIREPAGVETFKVVATAEPADFSPLLDAETVRGGKVRGEPLSQRPEMTSPIGRLLLAATMGLRAEPAAVDVGDWSTASVTFVVAPPQEED